MTAGQATAGRAIVLLSVCAALLTTPVRAQLSVADSAALNAKVHEETFVYLMNWRWDWWDTEGSLALDKERWAIAPDVPDLGTMPSLAAGNAVAPDRGANTLRAALSTQTVQQTADWVWPRTAIPLVDPRLNVDLIFPDDVRQDVEKERKPLLAQLDAAAKRLPGDGSIAAQRVRMHVDQGEPTQALTATRECKAARWWCLALRGFVWYSMGDTPRANAVFDSTLRVAPDSVKCVWNDVSLLLPAADAAEYETHSCADRAELTARIWWLADPLFLTPGNERKVEHYGRRMLLDLHTMVDSVDGLFDYRDRVRDDGVHQRIQNEIIRYGFPTTGRGCNMVCKEGPTSAWRRFVRGPTAPRPARGRAGSTTPPPTVPPPVQKWRRFDTKETYLGTYANVAWIGPQYHTIPSWAAINDPLHATDSDWSLSPPFSSRDNWDVSWWPTEFYARDEGPLFNLPTQVAFFRRAKTALIAAAAQWDTASTFRKPPGSARFGIAMSSGPYDTMRVIAGTVSGAKPPPVLSPISSNPMLLGVEMIPAGGGGDGAASRTRFGITPPAPLSQLAAGDIALSDPILVHVDPNAAEPTTFADAITNMYGTTQLAKPQRVAVAWEVYGLADGDTVDVSLRIVRHNDQGVVSRALSTIGIGRSAGADSLIVQWKEPRSGDRASSVDGGTTIRLRSLVLELSGLAAGSYSLEIVTARRGTATATARREFSIER